MRPKALSGRSTNREKRTKETRGLKLMRKCIVLEFISLDGVIQAPNGDEEDLENGFTAGGWVNPYADEVQGQAIREQMSQPFDLLLGRKTYENFAGYWPHHGDHSIGALFNNATKYVAS